MLMSATVVSFIAAGCGGGGSTTPTADTFDAQVAAGTTLFADHCAGCHGASGQGTAQAPPLVGLKTGALPLDPPPAAKVRTTQFVTVADVAAFAVANMPANAPGSLSADEYWDILAFDLNANGITLTQKLTQDVAATLTIPR
jgi:cytochrome c